MPPFNALPIEVKILVLGTLLTLGLWVCWRGLIVAEADWQNTSIPHMVRCIGQMLAGASLAPLAMLAMFWRDP